MEILKLLLSLLLMLFLFGCESDPFPIVNVYMIDQQKKTCDQYKLVDVENIKFKYDKELPFESCPLAFGFSKEDTGKLMSWIRRQKKNVSE